MFKIFMLIITFSFILAEPVKSIKPVKITLNNKTVITECDQVITDTFQKKCYLDKARKPKFNFYYLTDKIVNGSIKKRLSFKDDKRLNVSNYIKCFYKSGQDRGHLLPDASADYNKTLLKTTYLSSNIVPEKPYVNRVLIAKIEKEFRKIIVEYKNAYILTGAHYIYTDKYKFNPDNKYHLNCGYYPNYIYKIIWFNNRHIAYKIINEKPYKIIKLNQIQYIRLLKENNIKIKPKLNQNLNQRRTYGKF